MHTRLRVTRLLARPRRGADRVELLGIDHWVGGTRVRVGAISRWDASRQRLHAPS